MSMQEGMVWMPPLERGDHLLGDIGRFLVAVLGNDLVHLDDEVVSLLCGDLGHGGPELLVGLGQQQPEFRVLLAQATLDDLLVLRDGQ